ncbi:phospholipase (plasmid) [Ralstonia solanacearum]|uniref:phospholipase D-like domain-containing protein n=1 Tax=Ralstonia solanacearum TaxID=305 RepID=UPI0006DC9176|nr:phospholipase D-like domain-containing protein [Ralstonia solanacearum]QHB56734.1 phospholipase [Ralstonia solanacearum]
MPASIDSFQVKVYQGDSAVLFAFDVSQADRAGLAGFAIQCTPQGQAPYWVPNRLTFDAPVHAEAPLRAGRYADSIDAPFQSFHWVHFPPHAAGQYRYTVHARYFVSTGTVQLETRATRTLDVVLKTPMTDWATVGMVRGYVSSQAFIDHYGGNTALAPDNRARAKSPLLYDTQPYLDKYAYLGATGRQLIIDLLNQCKASDGYGIDVLAYDLDEPDILRAFAWLAQRGRKVRLIQDDSVDTGAHPTGHGTPDAFETQAVALLEQAGAEVRRTHLARFQHHKAILLRDAAGKPVRVLAGSANFSLRGLYVQANSVLVFGQDAAQLYADVFDCLWDLIGGEGAAVSSSQVAAGFRKDALAAGWHPVPPTGTPRARFAFSPHQTDALLTEAADRVKNAESSVLFAVMATDGGGAMVDTLEHVVPQKAGLLSLGVIDKAGGVSAFAPGRGVPSQTVSFAYLKDEAPAPFKQEVDAGTGQHIHHKFVVCDFNGAQPVVFCGSSNLSRGGEEQNGDSLIAIHDPAIVTAYAIEAVRLFDHYRFRASQSKASAASPLVLKATDAWADPYYDPHNIKFTERTLFAQSTEQEAALA